MTPLISGLLIVLAALLAIAVAGSLYHGLINRGYI